VSEASRDIRRSAPDAADVEARAAAWLERRDREDWSAADQEALNSWLAESPAHRLAYLRLYAAWTDADRLAVLRRSPPETQAARKSKRSTYIRVAVVTAFAIALSAAGVAYLLSPREQVYATTVGAHRTVRLADGSQIELNTDTVLRARISATQRKVWLDRGEAFFQVKHDAAHPFMVMAAGNRMLDVGTKFVVRRRADRLEVAMLEGSVRFYAADGQAQSRPALLTKGDVMVATTNSVSVTRKQTTDLVNALGWRRGVIVFKDTTLGDAVGELDRYNDRKVIVADASVARRTISGTIATTDVAAFIRVARNILGLRVETRGDEVVISR